MPKKLEKCVREVKEKIKKGETKKNYKCGKDKKKTCETNPYAICKASLKRSKKNGKK